MIIWGQQAQRPAMPAWPGNIDNICMDHILWGHQARYPMLCFMAGENGLSMYSLCFIRSTSPPFHDVFHGQKSRLNTYSLDVWGHKSCFPIPCCMVGQKRLNMYSICFMRTQSLLPHAMPHGQGTID
jgi:hypothetical protein